MAEDYNLQNENMALITIISGQLQLKRDIMSYIDQLGRSVYQSTADSVYLRYKVDQFRELAESAALSLRLAERILRRFEY